MKGMIKKYAQARLGDRKEKRQKYSLIDQVHED
jgi:hypothetical protein